MHKIEISYEKISSLKPAKYNPRQMDPETEKNLSKSIRQFGITDPLIVNKDGTIIGGHQRFSVAKKIGIKEIPIVRLNLDKKKEKILNLALNKIQGDFDYQKISKYFQEINGKAGEIALTGFSDEEWDSIMVKIEKTKKEVMEKIEKDGSSVSKAFEVYKNNTIKQIVFYFKEKDYEKVLSKFSEIMKKKKLESHTDVLRFLLGM